MSSEPAVRPYHSTQNHTHHQDICIEIDFSEVSGPTFHSIICISKLGTWDQQLRPVIPSWRLRMLTVRHLRFCCCKIVQWELERLECSDLDCIFLIFYVLHMFPAMTDTSIHPAFACGHAFAWALIAVWVVVSQIQQDPHRSTARGWHCLWSRIAVGIAAVVAQDLQLRITTLEGRVCAMCGNGTFVESILDLVWEWGKAHAEGRIYWDSGRNMMKYSYVPSSQILSIGYVLIKELPSISTRKLFYPLLVVYKWV